MAISIQERIERGRILKPRAWRRCGSSATSRRSRLHAGRLVQPLVDAPRSSRRTCVSACGRCGARRASRPPSSSPRARHGANAAIFSVVRGRAPSAAGQSRRRSARSTSVRARRDGAENTTFSVPEIDDLRVARQDDHRLRRVLDDRLHDDRHRRAAGRQGGSRQRPVLRSDGPSAGARPADRHVRRRAQRAGSGRADASLLDRALKQRSDGRSAGHPSGQAHRHHGRRPRAVGAVSGRHRDHRQRRHEPASSRRDDGDGAARIG